MMALLRFPKLLVLLLWVVASVTLYGFSCAVTGAFSRRLSQIIGSAWSRHLLWLSGIRVAVKGRERLDRNACYVFFSNHQSALDIPVLYAAIHNPLVFIAKKELFWIPVMGWGMHGMGHVVLDRSNPRKARNALSLAVTRLRKDNLSLVLFPEGTRSPDGSLQDFKQGSFALALESGVKIVPVTIEKANERLPKKSMAIRPGVVSVTIGELIDPTGLDKGALMARVRTEIQKALENKNSGNSES